VKEEPPKVLAPLKVKGVVVGDIVINPDGSFEGRISDRLTHVLWVAFLRDGYSDSMSLSPNIAPAIEAERTHP
jgi:hypothetical protein